MPRRSRIHLDGVPLRISRISCEQMSLAPLIPLIHLIRRQNPASGDAVARYVYRKPEAAAEVRIQADGLIQRLK